MKKVLLGTTALLAAGMFSGEAFAQARTPMTATNVNLSLGGFTQFRFEFQTKNVGQNLGVFDDDGSLADEPRKYNFDFDAELEFKGAATLSNGVKMGFEVELEAAGAELRNAAGKSAWGFDRTASCTSTGTNVASAANTYSGGSTCAINTNDIIDDNFMYVEGRHGKIWMGGLRDERYEIGIARTFSDVEAVAIDTTENPIAGSNEIQNFNNSIDLNTGRNKIIYTPPAIAGWKIALNWTPDNSMENSTQATQADDIRTTGAVDGENEIHIATQWAGSLLGNAVRVSAGWATQRPEASNEDAIARSIDSTPNISANTRWRLGADAKLLGFMVGGYYTKRNDNALSTDTDEKLVGWGIGATYELGLFEVGAALERNTQDESEADGGGQDKGTRWDIGVAYTGLGGGKTIRAGWRQDSIQDNLNVATNETKIRNIGVKYEWDVGPGLEFDVGYQNYRYTHQTGAGTDAYPLPTQRTTHAVMVQTKITF
ncbi:MAG: porin [Alphaproteobacteria bacterium]|nr:porin [Alphaproteobacteria bacterium]